MKLRRVSGSPNFQGATGILVQAEVDSKGKNVSGYWIAFTSTPVIPQDRVVVERLKSYDLVEPVFGGSGSLCNKAAPGMVNFADWNILKVRRVADSMIVTLNGQEACNFSDVEYQRGGIGLLLTTNGLDQPNETFDVDYVKIKPVIAPAKAPTAIFAGR